MNTATTNFPRADGLRGTPSVFFGLMLLAMPVIDLMLTTFTRLSVQSVLAFSWSNSLLIAQVYAALILSGICGRSWIEGLGLGSIWSACCGIAANIGLSHGPSLNQVLFQSSLVLFGMPVILLVGASPIYLCRLVLGWRLVTDPNQTNGSRLSIEDLLLSTSVIAAVLFAARASIVMQRSTEAMLWPWFPSLLLIPVLLIAILLVIPMIHWGLGSSALLTGAMRSALIVVLVLVVFVFLPASSRSRLHPGFVFLYITCTALLCGLVTILVRVDQWQLFRYGRELEHSNDRPSESPLNPFSIEEPSADLANANQERRVVWTPARAWTLAFIVFSICANLVAAVSQ